MSDLGRGPGSLIVNGRTERFASVLERSAAMAERLAHEVGLQPGDCLVVALENSHEHIELVVAAWRLGLQFVAVAPTTSGPTFAGIVESVSPQAVVVDQGNERLNRVVRGWARAISCWDGRSPDSILMVGRGRPTEQHSRPPRPDSLAGDWGEWLAYQPPAVFYTSGSTSTAKGVPLLWPRILDKARVVLSFYDVKPGDRVMPILPLSHVYGLYCLMGALALGADCVTFRESASPAVLARGLLDHAATIVICPPLVGAFLFGRHGVEPAVRDRLRVLSMGGAATSVEQAQRILSALPRTRVFLSYGLAETYSTISCNEVSTPGSDLASVGPLRFGAFGEARDPTQRRRAQHLPERDRRGHQATSRRRRLWRVRRAGRTARGDVRGRGAASAVDRIRAGAGRRRATRSLPNVPGRENGTAPHPDRGGDPAWCARENRACRAARSVRARARATGAGHVIEERH